MWIKIEEKRWLNMDNFNDVQEFSDEKGYKHLEITDHKGQGGLFFSADSPEAKAILSYLENQEERKRKDEEKQFINSF